VLALEGANGHSGNLKEFSIRMKLSLALATTLASGLVLHAAAQAPSAPAASAPASAASSAPAGPAKIAVVAFQVAVAQTNEGQRNFADLQKKYEPKRQQLKSLNDEIESQTKQLQTQGAALSDTEKASRAKSIDDKKKQLQREAEDAQNDMQQEMQELYNGLASKVYDVLAGYAKDHGYTLVLDVAQQQTPVLYATESTNITKAVIEAYNAKSGVPAPPAAPAAQAAPKTPGAAH
jgi:outer membrane protein